MRDPVAAAEIEHDLQGGCDQDEAEEFWERHEREFDGYYAARKDKI